MVGLFQLVLNYSVSVLYICIYMGVYKYIHIYRYIYWRIFLEYDNDETKRNISSWFRIFGSGCQLLLAHCDVIMSSSFSFAPGQLAPLTGRARTSARAPGHHSPGPTTGVYIDIFIHTMTLLLLLSLLLLHSLCLYILLNVSLPLHLRLVFDRNSTIYLSHAVDPVNWSSGATHGI